MSGGWLRASARRGPGRSSLALLLIRTEYRPRSWVHDPRAGRRVPPV